METHIHIHLDLSALSAVLVSQGAQIMEDVASLNAKMATLVSDVANERAEVQLILTGLRGQVTELSNQVAAGQVATQADLDAFGASLDTAIGGVTQISEPFPAVAPEPVVDAPAA